MGTVAKKLTVRDLKKAADLLHPLFPYLDGYRVTVEGPAESRDRNGAECYVEANLPIVFAGRLTFHGHIYLDRESNRIWLNLETSLGAQLASVQTRARVYGEWDGGKWNYRWTS